MKKIRYMVFCCALFASVTQVSGMLHRLTRVKKGITKRFVRLYDTQKRDKEIKAILQKQIDDRVKTLGNLLGELRESVCLSINVKKDGKHSFNVCLQDQDGAYVEQGINSIDNLATQLALLKASESSLQKIYGEFQLNRIYDEREKIKREKFEAINKDATKKELRAKWEEYFSGREN